MCLKSENMKKTPILFDKKSDCCGCAACAMICPKNAISMVADNEGFEYPVINEELCINCKICTGVCPIKLKR